MSPPEWSAALQTTGDGVSLRVKVVPGASRSRVAGMLGDRLKVAVAAPPEGGRANEAVCRLLADILGVSVRNVVLTAGQSQPRKTIEVIGVTLCDATERLQKLMGCDGQPRRG